MRRKIGEGAEAIIYSSDGTVEKRRPSKSYRIPAIDERLRRFRTRREAKILSKLHSAGFPSPRLLKVDDMDMKIKMQHIEGIKVRDILNSPSPVLARKIGEQIAFLHNKNIIHGDLTTSNFIQDKSKKIYFIDFGLSFFSQRIEDKAVDLHLLRQALEAKHHRVWKSMFSAALKGYSARAKDAKKVIKRLEQVELRGRNKAKY
jgi:Kae1-associated kinase Bud32